jgi:hypothetical protein
MEYSIGKGEGYHFIRTGYGAEIIIPSAEAGILTEAVKALTETVSDGEYLAQGVLKGFYEAWAETN